MKIKKKYMERLLKDWGISERLVEIPFVFNCLSDEPKTILDVGCIDSHLLEVFNEVGHNAWGVDIRPAPGRKNFTEADGRDLPFTDNKFDIATCISTLEHIGLVKTPYETDEVEDADGDIKTMREMERVVKKDGLLIITIPYGLCDTNLTDWIRFYNLSRLKELIGDLDVLKMDFYVRINDKWRLATELEASKKVSDTQVVSVCLMCLKKVKEV